MSKLAVNVCNVGELLQFIANELAAGRIYHDTIVSAPDYEGVYNSKGTVRVTSYGQPDPCLTIVGQWADYREDSE